MPSVSLVYDRKKTATRTRAAVVEIRISYDYRKKYISTGVKVLPKEWRNGMVTGRLDAIELNKALTTMRNKVLKAAYNIPRFVRLFGLFFVFLRI